MMLGKEPSDSSTVVYFSPFQKCKTTGMSADVVQIFAWYTCNATTC